MGKSEACKAAWAAGKYAHVDWVKAARHENRMSAVMAANSAKGAALTEKHRAEVLEFAAQRDGGSSKNDLFPWKVLEGRLGINHKTLLRIRRELGLVAQMKKAPSEGRLGKENV